LDPLRWPRSYSAREDREVRELIEKEAPFAPGAEKDQIVALLKGADGKQKDTLLGILKASSEAMEKSGLLEQNSGDGEGDGASAEVKIEKLVAEKIKKSDGEMDYNAAYAAVIAEREDLYEEYLSENPKQSG